MRTLALTTAAALLAALAADARPADDPAPGVAGAWVATAATHAGEAVPAEFFKGASLVLAKDGKYSSTLGEVTEQGTYTFDPTKKPAELDITVADGKKKRQVRAIVDLQGDALKVCIAGAGGVRPKDFTSTAANKHFVVTYARKK